MQGKSTYSERKEPMHYNIEILKKDHMSTSRWAGGTTTQLAIYPRNATLSEKNFKWRLSSAQVETEESTFTQFPGVSRHIMILQGELRLEHEGHHAVVLKPYQQDSFSGDWTTRSFGKVIDFNLMLAKGCTGALEILELERETCWLTPLEDTAEGHSRTEAFYCAEGSIEISINNEVQGSLYEGDVLLLHRKSLEERLCCKLVNQSENISRIIRSLIVHDEYLVREC